MAKRKRRTAVLYITNLAADVKFQFKAYCAKRNRTMTAEIEDMMKEKIREGKR